MNNKKRIEELRVSPEVSSSPKGKRKSEAVEALGSSSKRSRDSEESAYGRLSNPSTSGSFGSSLSFSITPPTCSNNNLVLKTTLEEKLASGFLLKNVKGDGNCFYRAISDQLNHNEETHMDLRRTSMDYINEHKPQFWDAIQADYGKSVAMYAFLHGKDGEYAVDIDISAMACALRRPIHIYRYGTCGNVVEPADPNGEPPIELAYISEIHYQSIVKDDFNECVSVDDENGENEEEVMSIEEIASVETIELVPSSSINNSVFDEIKETDHRKPYEKLTAPVLNKYKKKLHSVRTKRGQNIKVLRDKLSKAATETNPYKLDVLRISMEKTRHTIISNDLEFLIIVACSKFPDDILNYHYDKHGRDAFNVLRHFVDGTRENDRRRIWKVFEYQFHIRTDDDLGLKKDLRKTLQKWNIIDKNEQYDDVHVDDENGENEEEVMAIEEITSAQTVEAAPSSSTTVGTTSNFSDQMEIEELSKDSSIVAEFSTTPANNNNVSQTRKENLKTLSKKYLKYDEKSSKYNDRRFVIVSEDTILDLGTIVGTFQNMSSAEFKELIHDEESALMFAARVGLVNNTRICPKCQANDMNFKSGKIFQWQCVTRVNRVQIHCHKQTIHGTVNILNQRFKTFYDLIYIIFHVSHGASNKIIMDGLKSTCAKINRIFIDFIRENILYDNIKQYFSNPLYSSSTNLSLFFANQKIDKFGLLIVFIVGVIKNMSCEEMKELIYSSNKTIAFNPRDNLIASTVSSWNMEKLKLNTRPLCRTYVITAEENLIHPSELVGTFKDMSFEEFKSFVYDDESAIVFCAKMGLIKNCKTECDKCNQKYHMLSCKLIQNCYAWRCDNRNNISYIMVGSMFHRINAPLLQLIYSLYFMSQGLSTPTIISNLGAIETEKALRDFIAGFRLNVLDEYLQLYLKPNESIEEVRELFLTNESIDRFGIILTLIFNNINQNENVLRDDVMRIIKLQMETEVTSKYDSLPSDPKLEEPDAVDPKLEEPDAAHQSLFDGTELEEHISSDLVDNMNTADSSNLVETLLESSKSDDNDCEIINSKEYSTSTIGMSIENENKVKSSTHPELDATLEELARNDHVVYGLFLLKKDGTIDHCFYIGETWNPEERLLGHRNDFDDNEQKVAYFKNYPRDRIVMIVLYRGKMGNCKVLEKMFIRNGDKMKNFALTNDKATRSEPVYLKCNTLDALQQLFEISMKTNERYSADGRLCRPSHSDMVKRRTDQTEKLLNEFESSILPLLHIPTTNIIKMITQETRELNMLKLTKDSNLPFGTELVDIETIISRGTLVGTFVGLSEEDFAGLIGVEDNAYIFAARCRLIQNSVKCPNCIKKYMKHYFTCSTRLWKCNSRSHRKTCTGKSIFAESIFKHQKSTISTLFMTLFYISRGLSTEEIVAKFQNLMFHNTLYAFINVIYSKIIDPRLQILFSTSTEETETLRASFFADKSIDHLGLIIFWSSIN